MLGQLQDEILGHFEYMLNDMGMTEIPSNRFILSPTLDEEDHLNQLELALSRSRTSQGKLPFAVAARGQLGDAPTQRQFYIRNSHVQQVVTSAPVNGNAPFVRAAPIKLLYTYVIYADSPDFIDTFIENWILSSNRGYTAFTYAPTELGGTDELKVSITFGDIETVFSTIEDNRERGALFSLQLPIEIETVLTTALGATAPVILDTDTGLNLDTNIQN